MTKERKELIVLDGLTILFIVMLIVNGVTFALLYRWHNTQVFEKNLSNQKTYADLLAESRRLKNVIVENEGADSWGESQYQKVLAFHERGKKTYETAGISIDYPGDYASEISKDGKHLVLMTREEAKRIQDPTSPPGDGPMTITVDTYSREGKILSDWIKNSRESNFALSKGEYLSQKMGGMSVIVYEWSGLYEAVSYAVEGKDGAVVLLTVTFITRGEDIVKDFDLILSTLRRS